MPIASVQLLIFLVLHAAAAFTVIGDDVQANVAVMLTGVTGAGKSTACNFLFGEEVFTVGAGMCSVTPKSDSCVKELDGKKVQLIDTPGFCDDFEEDEERVNELGKAVLLAKAGVHAVALVINASHRFTASEGKALEEIELLGELWPFIFIIFTAARCYGTSEQKQRDAVLNMLDNTRCPEHFRMLMMRVNKRFMMLESTDPSVVYRTSKIKEFFSMVNMIYSTNKRLYTNQLFVKANELYQEEKQKAQNKEEELRKAQAGLIKMTAELQAAIDKNQTQQEKQQEIFDKTLTSLTSELNEAKEANKKMAEKLANMKKPSGICIIL